MYEEILNKFEKLEKDLSNPDISSNLEKLKTISKEHADLKPVVEMIKKLEKLKKESLENKKFLENDS